MMIKKQDLRLFLYFLQFLGIYMMSIFYKIYSFNMSNSAIDQNRPSYHRLHQQVQLKVTNQNPCRLILIVIILGFSAFYSGYSLTYFSAFSFNILISSEVLGIQGSGSTIDSILKGILPIGAIIGAAAAPFFMNLLTRKQFILVTNILALIISLVIQITNVYNLLCCRLIQGFIIGNKMTIIPLYVNELAPKQDIRNLAIITSFMGAVGLFSSYGIGLILNAANVDPYAFYHIMVSLTAATVTVQSILLVINFVPQSPHSLILKNKNEQLRRVVSMFTLEQFVDKAIRQKEIIVRGQQTYGQKQSEQTIKYSKQAYILGFELPFMQQMTGISGIITSATIIVSTISIHQYIKTFSPFILNFAQLGGVLCTIASLYVFGGKLLTLIGNLTLGLMDLAIGIIFLFQEQWEQSGRSIFMLLIMYNLIYGMTVGHVIWLYVPKIIPSKLMSLASAINWLGCSLCVIFTPIAINLSGGNPAWIFILYGVITLVFFKINYTSMVEIQGKSKQEISKQFLKQN